MCRVFTMTNRVALALVLVLAALRLPQSAAADRVDLREDPSESRILKVEVELSVSGKIYPEPGPEKALKLAVDAGFDYAERRLAGTGRDSLSLRSVRYYEKARATIEAGGQTSNSLLRKSLRLIVAHGQPEGIDLFSPSGPLTDRELDLLHVPGDSLAVAGLLPDSKVEQGETWKPAEWILPLLTGVDAIEKGELTCKLAIVKPDVARVEFAGEVAGATVGAAAAIRVEGHLLYDREQKLVTSIELTQSEKRAIGAVSPGLDVVAKVAITRAALEHPERLTDKDIADLPVESNAASRLLMFDAPAWNVRFYHDRHWHLFHQSAEVALLRLLDNGGLIA